MLNNVGLFKVGTTYHKVDNVYDAQELANSIVEAKITKITVCRVTGSFNMSRFSKLQTVSILSETEICEVSRGKIIKALSVVTVRNIMEDVYKTAVTVEDVMSEIGVLEESVD